jgi:hypothetical protein
VVSVPVDAWPISVDVSMNGVACRRAGNSRVE